MPALFILAMTLHMRLATYFLATAGALMVALPCPAATVSGSLVDRQGQPMAGRELHLEERVSGDAILVTTGKGGEFTVNAPPGLYDLRDEDGPIIRYGVVTTHLSKLDLGRVREPGFPWTILQTEAIAPALVPSAAAITAYVKPGTPIRSAPPPGKPR